MLHTLSYLVLVVFFFKQKTAYEMRISDWSSDVCSSDLGERGARLGGGGLHRDLHLLRIERGGQVVAVDPGPVLRRPARAGLRLVDVEALSFEVHLLFHGEEGVGIIIWGTEARRQRKPTGRPVKRVP